MIKVILFDLGGVLVDLDTDACTNQFINILGYNNIYNLLDPCHQRGIISDLEEGKISADEFRRLILKDSKSGSTPEDVDCCMHSLLTGMAESKAVLLKELSQSYRLFALSNNNPISMRRIHDIFEQQGLDSGDIFEAEFISSDMKMLKPAPEIYKEVVRLVGMPEEQMLFIDDSQSNINAARSLGIRAEYYEIGSDLRSTVMQALEKYAL